VIGMIESADLVEHFKSLLAPQFCYIGRSFEVTLNGSYEALAVRIGYFYEVLPPLNLRLSLYKHLPAHKLTVSELAWHNKRNKRAPLLVNVGGGGN
jgi:hypothetical protein